MKHYEVGTYKPVRDKKGRFSSFKAGIKKISFWVFIVFSVVYGSYLYGVYDAPTKYVQAEIPDTLTPKIEQLKNELVNDIKKCESLGHTESDGIIIFDSNDEASIGNLQFQRKTVIYYSKKLYGKDITPKQAIILALDEEEASKLAKDIIFTDSKGWKNWFNCGVKVEANDRVKFIKELAK